MGVPESFAVVDFETTGFSPRLGDRVVEVGVVRVGPSGEVEHEYETLVNPERDVGPTRIHQIRASDVAGAPTFPEIAGDLLELLADAVFVAHNVGFDRDFLAAELSRTGAFLPAIPSLCTLRLSYRLAPGLANHRLATCCQAAGIQAQTTHAALDDARSAALLLSAYLRAAQSRGIDTLAELGCEPLEFPSALWPRATPSGRRLSRRDRARASAAEIPYLARVVASLDALPSYGERMGPYLDLLDRALEDRMVSEAEGEALQATAHEWGLGREDVIGAHHAYLAALVQGALADSVVSDLERRDLETVTRLLAIDGSVLAALLATPQAARPTGSSAGVRAGMRVCFTGTLEGTLDGAQITREVAHALARDAGLVVADCVTKDLDLLVVADPNTMSGKAKLARKLGTRIMAEAAFWAAIGVDTS